MIDYPIRSAVGSSASQGLPAFAGPQYDKIVEIIDALNGSSGLPYGNDIGVADAYQVAIPNATLTDGYTFEVNIGNNNTGASTLQVNALGTYPILDQDGNPITADMLVAGSIYLFAFNTASYQLLGLAKPLNNAFVNNGNAFGGLATLGTLDNNDLAFITNNTEWMRVTASGNVGIGTSVPLARLHVLDSISGLLVGNTTGGPFTNTAAFGLGSTYAVIGFKQNTDVESVSNWLWQIREDGGAGSILLWRSGIIYTQISAKAGDNRIALKLDSGVDTFSIFGTDGLLIQRGNSNFGSNLGSARVHITGETSDATTYALKIQDVSLNLNFYVQNDGAVSSRLGYWLGGQLSYTNGGHVTSIYGGYLAGLTANATMTFNTVLGFNALAAVASVGNTAIGAYAAQLYTGDSITAIGYNAVGANISGIGITAIGKDSLANSTGSESTAVGYASGTGITAGGYNTFIGSRSGATGTLQTNQSYSIAIGYYSYTTAWNQCVIGNQQGFAHISEFVLGYGPDQPAFTIGDTMIRPTNVSAGVTDIANDYNIIYAGGRGTGTGKGSDIIFKVAPAGLTGSVQNPYVEILRFKNTGIINVASMQTGNAGLASGDLYVDTAANILANGDLVVGRKV